MRKDMFKVIVERARLGVRKAPRIKERRDPSPDRHAVGMKRAAVEQTGWTKSLNENLQPLRRYLRSQIDRPWDKVFSEICETLDTGSTVKQHVRLHLEDLIAIKVSIDRHGEWFLVGDYGPHPLGPRWPDLYVDPRTGIIRDTAKLARKKGIDRTPWKKTAVEPDDRVELGGDIELRRIDGIWYRFRLGETVAVPPKDDLGGSLPIPYPHQRRRYNQPPDGAVSHWRRVVEKRQLGKAELRKHGLKNLPE